METGDQDEVNAFVMNCFRALQRQNRELLDLVRAHEERIQVLERQDMWNLMRGITVPPPQEDHIVRLANGRIANIFADPILEEEFDGD